MKGKDTRPVVSVVVPVYNIDRYLGQCIDSILNQTYTSMEVLLVDDGSTDQSGAMCDRYALIDDRIRVIHKENEGLVSARKAGVSAAGGEYITFVDGDDWIEPDTYRKLLETGGNADIIAFACYEEYGDYQTMRQNGVQEGLYTTTHEKELLYTTMFMDGNFFEFGLIASLWSKLIKKDIIGTNQKKVSNKISFGEDVACTFPCLLDATTICVTNLPLYHYRQRQGSIVKGSARVPRGNFINIYRLLHEKFKASPIAGRQLQGQLHYYMWFILLAKAYGDLEMKMPLFPFPRICHGSRIAIYGAGTFGKAVRDYCDQCPDIHVAGWSDAHYSTYQKQGLNVIGMDELQELEFDFVVIAILNEPLAESIKQDFVNRGILEEKIDWVKKRILREIQLPDWVIK